MTDDQEASLAWDRVGRLMQQADNTYRLMSKRNLQTWGQVSSHLRKDKYSADDMAKDAVTVYTSAIKDMTQLWWMWTDSLRAESVAQELPTAFLLFELAKHARHRLPDPVRIDMDPEAVSDRKLPKYAEIALNGRTSVKPHDQQPGRTSRDGVAELHRCLVASRKSKSATYLLQTVHDKGSKHHSGLVPGVYDGVVYLSDPPLALANLRILVEGPPQDVDGEEDDRSSNGG